MYIEEINYIQNTHVYRHRRFCCGIREYFRKGQFSRWSYNRYCNSYVSGR